MSRVYVVPTRIEYVTYDREGREVRVSFPAGPAKNPTEDEQFVLERVLAPAGMASRTKQQSQEQ